MMEGRKKRKEAEGREGWEAGKEGQEKGRKGLCSAAELQSCVSFPGVVLCHIHEGNGICTGVAPCWRLSPESRP